MSMQGWRTKMEDSHIAQTNLPNNVSVFGVFDGHGDKHVATHIAERIPEEIRKEMIKNP